MSDYVEAFVILDDESTYGSAEGAVVSRTTFGINLDAVDDPIGALTSMGDTVSLVELLAVYDAATGLLTAPKDEDGLPISDEFLACLDALHVARYGKG